MEDKQPTPDDIAELLAFLPVFSAPGFEAMAGWEGDSPTGTISLDLPAPVYADSVIQFFRVASRPCWNDDGYDIGGAKAMLVDRARVREATLAELKTMLTWCVRGERFCDGHWGEVVDEGHIVRILERLAELP